MKKALYIFLIIIFAAIITAARIIWFSDSSFGSYMMGMTYMALCSITYECLVAGRK